MEAPRPPSRPRACKTRACATLAFVFLCLAPTGCGSEDAAAPAPPPAPPPAATATTPAPPPSSPSAPTEEDPSGDDAIVVETPRPGEKVSSPVHVAGEADVFEANVTIRILDANDTELAETFTTATCGSGCRGDFSARVPFQVDREQPGTLVLSDDDADGDGKPQHEVRVPIVLVPSP